MNTWSKIGIMIDAVEQVNIDYRIGTKSRITRECLIGQIISILLVEKNGLMASVIAHRLGVSRRMINSIVYKMSEFDICKRDSNYVWKLV